MYVPGYTFCVDVQLVKFRGHCKFQVYMKTKPGKYGLKIWAVVDVVSGYILKLDPYIGKTESITSSIQSNRLGYNTEIVLKLVDSYANSGREVADNCFSSVELFVQLLRKGLTYCGTLRPSRKGVPPFIKIILPGAPKDTFIFNEERQITIIRHVCHTVPRLRWPKWAFYGQLVVTVSNPGNRTSNLKLY